MHFTEVTKSNVKEYISGVKRVCLQFSTVAGDVILADILLGRLN